MDEIEKNLDLLGVPGSGLTWERILKLAQNYYLYDGDLLKLDKPIEKEFKLSDDQELAWNKIKTWITNEDRYFVLRGYAGSGKSYLLKKLVPLDKTIYFSSPTNKATKVLSKFTSSQAKTIYSLLGIKMVQVEDKLQLTFSDYPPYFPKNSIIVIDESSMIGYELFSFIKQTVERTNCKILFVGDPAQLPPVGEPYTKAWKVTDKKENRAFMKQVIRYDNQLLKLATKVRKNLLDREYVSPLINDNDGTEGVFLVKNRKTFIDTIKTFYDPSYFKDLKIIAWRNKTVNYYNDIIRDNFGFTKPYEPRDTVLIAEPVEKDGQIIATIDDEFIVESVISSVVKTGSESVEVWKLVLKDEDTTITINVAKEQFVLDKILTNKANSARDCRNSNQRRILWKEFWKTKALFHKVRYGYAITAHRAQGSTYERAFVDQQDIMGNQNKREALRCLYVAVTRASKSIYSY